MVELPGLIARGGGGNGGGGRTGGGGVGKGNGRQDVGAQLGAAVGTGVQNG